MASRNTRGAAEKTDLIDQLTNILDSKLNPINEKLSKLDAIETSLNDAHRDIKRSQNSKKTLNLLRQKYKT